MFRQQAALRAARATCARNLLRPDRFARSRRCSGSTCSIRRGEIVAYAGPNGAGKSTTIKLLSGLLAPDAGTVRALGMDPVRDRVRYVGRIGVVFGQRTELWWDHPVAASFEWKRVVWDIPRPRYERMLGLVRELLGLDEFFNSLARELSLGQRMRAELGLALLHEPEILFLDEPTIGLDVLAKRTILGFIKELNRERHVTVMVTSHDMAELEQLAGRIVMIDHGEIAFDGDFDRLRRECRPIGAGCCWRPAIDAAGVAGRRAAGAKRGRAARIRLRRRPDARSPSCWSRPPPNAGAGRRDAPRADRRGDRRYLSSSGSGRHTITHILYMAAHPAENDVDVHAVGGEPCVRPLKCNE